MRKITWLGIALLQAVIIDSACADEFVHGWYGQVTGAALFPEDQTLSAPETNNTFGIALNIDYDPGWAIDFAGGYRFENGFRLQGEVGYARANFDSVTLDLIDSGVSFARFRSDVSGGADALNWSLGAFYDLNTDSRFTPYIGGGIGGNYTSVDNIGSSGSSDDINVSAYGEAGLAFDLTDRLSLVPAYRFQWINSGNRNLEDFDTHEFRLGLRWFFD